MKTKLVVRPCIIAIRFDERSFFTSILGFTPLWVYKRYSEHINQKIINLSTLDRVHMKCDIIDGSVLNGIRKPILFSFFI